MLQHIEQLLQSGEESKLKKKRLWNEFYVCESPDAFARNRKEVHSPFLEYTEFEDDGDFELSLRQERRRDVLEPMPAPSTENVDFNVTDWPHDAFPFEYEFEEMGMPFEMIRRQSSVSSETVTGLSTAARILHNDTHSKLFLEENQLTLEENQLTSLEEFQDSESLSIGGDEFSEESGENSFLAWENDALDWEDPASEISVDIESYGGIDIVSSPSSKIFQDALESHGDDPRVDLAAEISHDEEEEESEESERLAWLDAVQFRDFFHFPLRYLQPCHRCANKLYE